MSIYSEEKRHIVEDTDGNIIEDTTDTLTRNIQRNDEPDYIKVYTKMWSDFNGIPQPYQELFFQLAIRMTYCNSSSINTSQIVYTGQPVSTDIMNTLNWKKRMYQLGLKVLRECGAIRKLARGVYQINPSYAGKGEWYYNPKLNRGGVKDLIAEFNFKEKTVKTQIIWGDDGKDNEINEQMRKGTGSKKGQNAVLQSRDVIPGQISLDDIDMDDIDNAFKNAVGE